MRNCLSRNLNFSRIGKTHLLINSFATHGANTITLSMEFCENISIQFLSPSLSLPFSTSLSLSLSLSSFLNLSPSLSLPFSTSLSLSHAHIGNFFLRSLLPIYFYVSYPLPLFILSPDYHLLSVFRSRRFDHSNPLSLSFTFTLTFSLFGTTHFLYLSVSPVHTLSHYPSSTTILLLYFLFYINTILSLV